MRMKFYWYWTVPPDKSFEQTKQFTLATGNFTAMAITKLDGTAKGGVVIGISII